MLGKITSSETTAAEKKPVTSWNKIFIILQINTNKHNSKLVQAEDVTMFLLSRAGAEGLLAGYVKCLQVAAC